MEDLKKQVLDELSKHYTQATSNVSKVSRTWAITIMAPALTLLYKEDATCSSVLFIVIIGLSLFSLLLDGIQYVCSATRMKRLIDAVYDNQMQLDNVSDESRKVYSKTYVIVILKFIILAINTVLLLLYSLLMRL